jgi:hypothetical protein
MVQVEAVRRRNLHGAAHCNGGALPMLAGNSAYGTAGGTAGGLVERDPLMPWICSACAGLTGRI